MNVPQPSLTVDWFIVAMPFAIAAFLLFLGSRFFLTAGMAIDLPSEFPSICEHIQTEMAIAVRGSDNFVCGDMLLDGCELEKHLESAKVRGRDGRRVVLLHCDRKSPIEGLLRAAEIAKRCGFDSVQIAIANGDGKIF
jgi:biopolymer transport protein ExbD